MSKSQFLKENLRPGEHYAGIVLGRGEEDDYHLFLLPGEAEAVTWQEAKAFSSLVGGELPTRREQALLFANLRDQFKPDWYWYWSSEQHASHSGCAWGQSFANGCQGYDPKCDKFRARAIRRVPIPD